MTTTTTGSLVDDGARRADLRRHLESTGVDADVSHALYADDAVLEFPQSGERFEGVATFREWRAGWRANPCPPIRVMPTGATVVA